MVTWARVEALALELPAVTNGMQRGKPALKVANKGFFHLNDGPTMSLASPDKEGLLLARPDTFTSDGHQTGTPWFTVRLEKITEDELRELLLDTWRIRAPSGLRRQHPDL